MVSNLTLAVRCDSCCQAPAETLAPASDALPELGFRTPFDELHERVIGTQFETPARRTSKRIGPGPEVCRASRVLCGSVRRA